MLDLLSQVTGPLTAALGSPWLWVIVFGVSALDALLPFMPSEGSVILVAVLLGADFPALVSLVLLAAVGALAGDCLGHLLGRNAGPRVIARLQRGEKSARRYEWARATVTKHAVLLIIAGRYLPGGRVASGLATGALRYPFGRFVVFDALGALLWAVYSVAIGFAGGARFAGEPEKGLLLAFGLGLLMVGVIELLRRGGTARSGATREDRQPCQRQNADM